MSDPAPLRMTAIMVCTRVEPSIRDGVKIEESIQLQDVNSRENNVRFLEIRGAVDDPRHFDFFKEHTRFKITFEPINS